MNYLVKTASWGFGEGGAEELRYQSRQCQELSTDVTGHQLIFKMSSEHQTVDHTNELRERSRQDPCVIADSVQDSMTQTL
jgi:hypothetical protein